MLAAAMLRPLCVGSNRGQRIVANRPGILPKIPAELSRFPGSLAGDFFDEKPTFLIIVYQ
jgi:hypothetical protein